MTESIQVDHRSLATEQGRKDFQQALRDARDRAKARLAATCTRIPPPENASVESSEAHKSSVLADIGRDILAAFDMTMDGPGPKRVVAIRVEQRRIEDLERCVRSRTREMHLATRARRTERELQTDAFPDIDDLESTAHIFLAYDDFEATHTLGVARIVNLPVGGGSSSSSPHGPKPTVDRFFATTLSMIPDPVRFPVMVRTLLLEACHECVRRAGSTEFDLVTSAPNHVPASAKPRTNEAPSSGRPCGVRAMRTRENVRTADPVEDKDDVSDVAEEAAIETRTEARECDARRLEAEARRHAAANVLRRLDDIWDRTKLNPSKNQLEDVAAALVGALLPALTPGRKSCETAVDTLVGGLDADADTLRAIASMSQASIAARSNTGDSCIHCLDTRVAASPNSSASVAELTNVLEAYWSSCLAFYVASRVTHQARILCDEGSVLFRGESWRRFSIPRLPAPIIRRRWCAPHSSCRTSTV